MQCWRAGAGCSPQCVGCSLLREWLSDRRSTSLSWEPPCGRADNKNTESLHTLSFQRTECSHSRRLTCPGWRTQLSLQLSPLFFCFSACEAAATLQNIFHAVRSELSRGHITDQLIMIQTEPDQNQSLGKHLQSCQEAVHSTQDHTPPAIQNIYSPTMLQCELS